MKFSIVICNYNYGRFLSAAIESCLQQNYPQDDIEIIAVDDGSKDNSSDVLTRYEKFPNVIPIRQSNRGQGATLAAGVAAATGDYVCLLDSDDVYFPTKLRRLREHIESLGSPSLLFLCHDVRLYDDSASSPTEQSWFEIVGVAGLPTELSLEQCDHQFPFAIPCGQVFGRSLAQRVFDSLPGADWRYAADSPIGHTAFLSTGSVHYLHECLAYYRIHGANDLARLENGRYRPGTGWKPRLPSLVGHLERYIDTLSWDGPERAVRLGYLKNKERALRVTPPQRHLGEPGVGFIVDGRGKPASALKRTLGSISAQQYSKLEIAVLDDDDRDILTAHGKNVSIGPTHSGEIHSHATALEHLDTTFIALLDAGIEIAPDFAAQHVRCHQFAGIAHLSFCDSTLRYSRSLRTLTHLGIQTEQLGPFARPLMGLALPSLNSAVLRRTSLATSIMRAAEESKSANWKTLFARFMHVSTGSIFVADRLVTAEHLTDLMLPALLPDNARQELWMLYCATADTLAAATTPSWRCEFVRWLCNETSASETERMMSVAQERGADEALGLLNKTAAGIRA